MDWDWAWLRASRTRAYLALIAGVCAFVAVLWLVGAIATVIIRLGH